MSTWSRWRKLLRRNWTAASCSLVPATPRKRQRAFGIEEVAVGPARLDPRALRRCRSRARRRSCATARARAARRGRPCARRRPGRPGCRRSRPAPVAISARRRSSTFDRLNGSPGLNRAIIATWRALNGGWPLTRIAPNRATGPGSTGSVRVARWVWWLTSTVLLADLGARRSPPRRAPCVSAAPPAITSSAMTGSPALTANASRSFAASGAGGVEAGQLDRGEAILLARLGRRAPRAACRRRARCAARRRRHNSPGFAAVRRAGRRRRASGGRSAPRWPGPCGRPRAPTAARNAFSSSSTSPTTSSPSTATV